MQRPTFKGRFWTYPHLQITRTDSDTTYKYSLRRAIHSNRRQRATIVRRTHNLALVRNPFSFSIEQTGSRIFIIIAQTMSVTHLRYCLIMFCGFYFFDFRSATHGKYSPYTNCSRVFKIIIKTPKYRDGHTRIISQVQSYARCMRIMCFRVF
jgi:hypothetical protein